MSDSTENKAGFVATVTNVDPVCGSHNVMNATNATQVITSPNFPSDYPSNVRCRWTLSAPRGFRIEVKIVDLFTEESPGCARDAVIVEDIEPHYRSRYSQGHNTSTMLSSYSNYYTRSRWHRVWGYIIRNNVAHLHLAQFDLLDVCSTRSHRRSGAAAATSPPNTCSTP